MQPQSLKMLSEPGQRWQVSPVQTAPCQEGQTKVSWVTHSGMFRTLAR